MVERVGTDEASSGQRRDWPVEWQPVWGTVDGPLARFEAWFVQTFLGLAARLPEMLLELWIAALARFLKLVDRRHARTARAFLRQALGEMPHSEVERRVLLSYKHFLRVLVEPRRFLHRVAPAETPEHFDVRWNDEVERVRASGKGCILLTGHIGNWEAAIAAAPWFGFDPVYAIARPMKNRPLSRAAQHERERRGIRLLPRRGAMTDSPKILRAGGAVGMLLDQRARKRPVLAPFFGRPARCDRSAGVLMKRLRVPVVLCACYLTDRPLYYRAEFFDVLWPEELAGASPAEIATRINRGLERMILAAPEQYFWLHDRFKDTPESFPADKNDSEPSSADSGMDGSVPQVRADPTDEKEIPQA